MRFSILILLAAASAAPAQIVTFGVTGGVPVTTAPFEPTPLNGENVGTGHWTIGPTVEFHITHALSIEADGLYRSYHVSGTGFLAVIPPGLSVVSIQSSVPIPYSFKHSVRAWDLPAMAKYRFGKGPVKPFVSAGASYTHDSADITVTCTGSCAASGFELPQSTGSGISTANENRVGEVFGGGVEWQVGKIRFAPQVRYTRLNKPAGNETSILLGVTF